MKIQTMYKVFVRRPGQSFGENICQIVLRIDALGIDKSCLDLFPNEVMLDVNVFGPAVELRIPGEHQG
jgi:hypothetical protein